MRIFFYQILCGVGMSSSLQKKISTAIICYYTFTTIEFTRNERQNG